jgi:pyruvate,water dikinase
MAVLAGSISVAVMKMVKGRSAGVAFSADPTTGDRMKIIINGNWGVGESVVQGEVTPDHYIIDKQNLNLVEKNISKKVKCYAIKEEGTEQQEVPIEKQTESCLSDEEAIRIAELTKIVEGHYGKPQDVEWVVDGDLPFPQNVFLVQARPITALPEWKSPTDRIIDYLIKETKLRP